MKKTNVSGDDINNSIVIDYLINKLCEHLNITRNNREEKITEAVIKVIEMKSELNMVKNQLNALSRAVLFDDIGEC